MLLNWLRPLGPNGKDTHHRFHSAEEIAKLSGCVPIVKQSGKWEKVSIRHACVRSLRRTFHDWAFTSLKTSSWARAYYDYHKARNQSHFTILRNLGKKWIKILLPSGQRVLLTMKLCTFKTSRQEISPGLWLCDP